MRSIIGGDTIAAVATPRGEGGLAVIRVSGGDALPVADRVFLPAGAGAPKPSERPTHTLCYGFVIRDDRRIDEALLSVMRAPRSFTREDVVEISCHGGMAAVRETMDAILEAGARMAEPGEFTRRAFLNGRIDLAQAEAVADIISARTDRALAVANEQLAGGLSRRVEALRETLISALAHIEAYLDFPDEDISPDTESALKGRLAEAVERMEALLATANQGRVLRKGALVAIVGRPNAGKSSLLNRMVDGDRAIVSQIPGTTRDTIEETCNINGLPVTFVDTAGIRDTEDEIELEGVRRSHQMRERADVTIHVIDGSAPLSDPDREFIQSCDPKRTLVALNKVDLGLEAQIDNALSISCATEEGLEEFKKQLCAMALAGSGSESTEITINARHQDALRRAKVGVEATLDAIAAGQPLEIIALELRIGLNAVGEIVGRTSTDDLLDQIFGEFCLGK